MTKDFGLSARNFKEFLEILKITKTKSTDKNATFFVFGSRATGKNKGFSDLDLLCKGLTSQEISELKEIFNQSSLAIKIDVVSDEELNPKYRDQIEKEKVALKV